MKRATRKQPEHRVAVIEEVADNIYSLKFILQSLGYEVSSFASGTSSLNELIDFAPEVVIVDMMIPHKGGYAVIRQLSQEAKLSDIPVLAITADAMEGSEEEVLQAGGRDVLSKPYSVADLQARIQQWLVSKDPDPAESADSPESP